MSGIHDVSAQHIARVALYEAIKVALAGEDDVDIRFGFRWPVRANDWVTTGDTDSDIDPATIGARRSVDERIALEVSIGSWRPEVPDDPDWAELEVSRRAFDLLAKIQRHIRLNDVTLGGTVLWCMPGSSSSAGATSDAESAQGRIVEVAATFICQHRIS